MTMMLGDGHDYGDSEGDDNVDHGDSDGDDNDK